MNYKLISKDMRDKEVQMLMSMLVPGSSICRVERLHDINAINVCFKKEVSEQELMITFYPDEVDECQFHIPVENTTVYTLYNFLNGYSTFWSKAAVEQGVLKIFNHKTPVLDEMICFREKQFLEKKELNESGTKCSDVWNRIMQYSMESGSGLREDIILLEELNDTFNKEFRKCFYVQGLLDAYRAFRLLGLLRIE